jgi:murein DD-endopeptidase MepM/ murein hydrolase activator NlpD
MQIMITAGSMARTRVLQVGCWQIGLTIVGFALALMMFSGATYHFVLIKAAQAGWPVVSQIVGLVVRDEMSQRDRFLRENLDAMAERLGEIQAKMVKLEAVGERVAGLAGVKADDVVAQPTGQAVPKRPAAAPPSAGVVPVRTTPANAGQGGPFVAAPAGVSTLDELGQLIGSVELQAEQQSDLFLLIESRLLERRLSGLMVPSIRPVDTQTGSGFGFRIDPFTGRPALHTGLDFPADIGTPILAAAGGVVLTDDNHPAYGRMVEIDHGRGLITRYAHASRLHVKAGDIVRRGQKIAEVGNSGRSTGPHLHFEVLVDNVPQDPARFLAAAPALNGPQAGFAARPNLAAAATDTRRGGPLRELPPAVSRAVVPQTVR